MCFLGDITIEEVGIALLRIYDICNVAPSSGSGDGRPETDDTMFDSFTALVGTQFSPRERNRFLSRTLPCMARYALALSELRPRNHSKFDYCMAEVQPYSRRIDRRYLNQALFLDTWHGTHTSTMS